MIRPTTNDRRRPWLLIVEAVIVAGIFYLDWIELLPFSKTPFLFILGWLSLRMRGQRWRDVGFRIPANWPTLLFVGLLAGIGMEALELFATQPVLTKLLGQGPDLSDLNSLVGNTTMLILFLLLVWVGAHAPSRAGGGALAIANFSKREFVSARRRNTHARRVRSPNTCLDRRGV